MDETNDQPAAPLPGGQAQPAAEHPAPTDIVTVDEPAAKTEPQPEPAPEWGVAGLTRARVSPGFSLWHLDMPEFTSSGALTSGVLNPAAEFIGRGDVVFITTYDGVLMRSLYVLAGSVFFQHLA